MGALSRSSVGGERMAPYIPVAGEAHRVGKGGDGSVFASGRSSCPVGDAGMGTGLAC